MGLPIAVGLLAALIMIVAGGFRFWTGRAGSRVLRNPDGSMYGGLVRVTLGIGILWFVIGAMLTWLITSIL